MNNKYESYVYDLQDKEKLKIFVCAKTYKEMYGIIGIPHTSFPRYEKDGFPQRINNLLHNNLLTVRQFNAIFKIRKEK